MNRECPRNQSVAAYAARSRRLARRALMIRIASASPLLLNVYATMSTRPLRDRPSRRNRDSADECCRSGPSSASGSRKTLTASSNETACFTALASAFRGSHSNTYLVYTKCPARLDRAARTRAHGVVRRNCESGFVSELCHIPPETRGKYLQLRGHLNAYRCWVKSLKGNALVGFGVRQHARSEPISKRAPSSASARACSPRATARCPAEAALPRRRDNHSDISPFKINNLQSWLKGNIGDCDKSSNVRDHLRAFKYSRAITPGHAAVAIKA
jgi:hypothetical protein